MTTVEDVVGSLDAIMGAKAVWSRLQDPVMCFGARGEAHQSGYFALGHGIAERALTTPYIVAIGGGKLVPPDLEGRLIAIVRATGVYGETKAFVQGPSFARLKQWPVAVVCPETYSIDGEPDLIRDLGLKGQNNSPECFRWGAPRYNSVATAMGCNQGTSGNAAMGY